MWHLSWEDVSQPVDTNVSYDANAVTLFLRVTSAVCSVQEVSFIYTQFWSTEFMNSTLHFCKLPRVNALKTLTI